MDSLIFELEIIFHFQLFLSANVRHKGTRPGEFVFITGLFIVFLTVFI